MKTLKLQCCNMYRPMYVDSTAVNGSSSDGQVAELLQVQYVLRMI